MQDGLLFDILPQILESLGPNFGPTLYNCALVNWLFKDAVTPILYQRIVLRSLRWSGGIHNYSALKTLNDHPHMRSYVREIIHCPSDETIGLVRPNQTNNWADSFFELPNLVSFTLQFKEGADVPYNYGNYLITSLIRCTKLQELHLLFDVDAHDISKLDSLLNLRTLKLGRPSYDTLIALSRISRSYMGLSIMNTQALSSQTIGRIPHFFANLKQFVLGRHHTLSNHDILTLLRETPHLQVLDVYYDNFMNSSNAVHSFSGLPSLSQLVIRHQGVARSEQFSVLFSWLGQIIAPSPLTSLSIISDDSKECKRPNPLIHVLKSKASLRVLNISHIHLKSQDILSIFGAAPMLEVLSFYLVETQLHNVDVHAGFINKRPINLAALYVRTRADYREAADYTRKLTAAGEHMRLRRVGKEGHSWLGLWSGTNSHRIGLDPLVDESNSF